jgi:hypothetical protein
MVSHVMAPTNLWTRLLTLAVWEWFYNVDPPKTEDTKAIRDCLAALTPPALDDVARDVLALGAQHGYRVGDLVDFWYVFGLPHSHAMPMPVGVPAQDGH